jgi:RNA recognition motif-containing protein
VKEEELFNFFNDHYGEVEKCHLVTDEKGHSKGFGFV